MTTTPATTRDERKYLCNFYDHFRLNLFFSALQWCWCILSFFFFTFINRQPACSGIRALSLPGVNSIVLWNVGRVTAFVWECVFVWNWAVTKQVETHSYCESVCGVHFVVNRLNLAFSLVEIGVKFPGCKFVVNFRLDRWKLISARWYGKIQPDRKSVV